MLSGLFSRSAASSADFSHLQRASIEFRQAAKRYGDHQVLNGINLQVEPGEVVAILGPSGSGKSTLIRLINQLESLSGGEILIDGKPTASLRQRAAPAAQPRRLCFPAVQPLRPPDGAGEYHPGAGARSRLGKAPPANARWRCCNRSGWRIKPARCRPSSPAASSSAWPSPAPSPRRRKLFCSMTHLGARSGDDRRSAAGHEKLAHSGITMVVVTHEMQFAREIADRVVFIDGGDILEVAPPAEFFARPQHARTRRFLQRCSIRCTRRVSSEPGSRLARRAERAAAAVDHLRLSHHRLGQRRRDDAGHRAGGPAAGAALRRRPRRTRLVACWVSLFRNTPLLVQLLFWYFAAWNLLPLAARDFINADHAWSILPGNVWWLTPEFLCSMWGLGSLPRRFWWKRSPPGCAPSATVSGKPRCAGFYAVGRTASYSAAAGAGERLAADYRPVSEPDEALVAGQRHRLCRTDLSGAANRKL
jgi:polar amino acid transport system ATP-binding protein